MLAATGTVPTYRPVTMPVGETVAKLGSATAQKTFRPVSTLPEASKADAESVTVAPITTDAAGGATCTLATGGPECSSPSLLQATTASAVTAATASTIQVGCELLMRSGAGPAEIDTSVQRTRNPLQE